MTARMSEIASYESRALLQKREAGRVCGVIKPASAKSKFFHYTQGGNDFSGTCAPLTA